MRILYKIFKILPVSVRWVLAYLSQEKYTVGVAGIIFFESKLLLVKPTYQYCWCLPGGFVENDDSAGRALQREIKEELGLEIVIDRIEDVVIDKQARIVSIIIFGHIFSLDGKMLNSEIEECEFYELNSLPNSFYWQHANLVEKYLKNR